MKILLGVTGSVAAKLTPKLVEQLLASKHEVQVAATKSSLYFWSRADFPVRVWSDKDEWPGERYVSNSKIIHIALREWADVLLIAPLSANTLGKLANGLADNLLTSVARAWKRDRPVILAPAMNTCMWEHPATAEHLAKLVLWYPKLTVVSPVSKLLACGDAGLGAIADLDVIVAAIPSESVKI